MRRATFLVLAVTLAGCGDVTTPSGVDTGSGDPTPTAGSVSFSNDVFPAFERRNCVQCHSGNGPGRDDGGLMLDGGVNPVHREVTQETSPNHDVLRVDVDAPAASLLVVMPLGTGVHGRFFADTSDPDYALFVTWISEGAQKN